MNFIKLGISENIQNILKGSGITEPTPIQVKCIPQGIRASHR